MNNTKKPCDSQRRTFFKTSAVALGSIFLAPMLTRGKAFGAEPGKPVDEKDPLASAMGYKKDATKVDTKKYPKRAGAEGKTQFCNNCQFFTPGADKKTGACQIFSGGVVQSKGWCNSWTKKA